MKSSSKLTSLVNQMPDPDGRGMYCTDIDKKKIDKAITQLYTAPYKGSPDNIIGIIDMLVPPGQGNDVKAHYALHCLALHVCKLKDDNHRRWFARTVASQLGGDRPKAIQRYLVRVLQVAGGREVVRTLGKLLVDEELCEPAAQALVAIGNGAAGQLRSALPRARGKCRLTVIQNLGVVRDDSSVDALKNAVTDEDQDIRIGAAWALANIGDPGSAGVLLKAADAEGWERTQATKACLLLAENLLAAGKNYEAMRIYTHLRNTRTEPAERYVRDAAKKALTAASGK